MNRERKKHRLKPIWKITLLVILASCTLYLTLGMLFSKRIMTIQINGSNPEYAEYAETYKDPGASAELSLSWLPFIHRKAAVEAASDIDVTRLGTYTVTYTAVYGSVSASESRTVIVRDTIPPVITLTTDPDHYTLYNHPYEEEGYTAEDNHDGDLTAQVTSHEDNGTVYYSVTDASGNTAEAKRKIIYDDRTAPAITLNGGSELIWYTDAGPFRDSYSAVDDADGDVSGNVQIEGSVDSNIPGDYTLKYTVSDAHGNTAESQRIIHVQNRPVNHTGQPESASTIYLTFDDGPGPYTDQLLAVLAKYNVKATFFTTSTRSGYADEIAKEAAAGHTVAIHTYSHNYAKVYASADAYWADFDAQNNVIRQETGAYTTLFRFPGGSSNTVSKDYCPGIMTTLIQQADQLGYTYFDWNVSSGDAGGTTSSDDVFNNVTSQITRNHSSGYPSVVLQHDIKDFSVNAVERIIQWGLANGYNFQALSSSSYKAHHHVNN